MESNRDEAERCIHIAAQSLRDSKLDRAEKFLNKAEKLYPTQKAKDLLERVLAAAKENNDENESIPTDGSSTRRRNTAGKSPSRNEEKSEPDYTSEQLQHVKRIKSCKDYYEVLKVTKDATDTEIKKSYKKIALVLHPDKNRAPGAAEAFKAVGNAVAILTDSEKRKRYDMYGSEEQQRVNRNGSFRTFEGGFSRGFEADVTAEELFNMFFGGGSFTSQNVYSSRSRRFHRQPETEDREQGGYAALFNLIPILLLIILSGMSSFFISDPIYSLSPSVKYAIERRTVSTNIPYFVTENFHEYQGSLGRLEAAVEDEYKTNLRYACNRERNYRESMLMKARNFGNKEHYRKAQKIETPSCDKFEEFKTTGRF